GDDVRSLGVGDVDALDAQRSLGQAEVLLDLLERLAAGGQVRGPFELVLDERFLRVLRHGLQHGLLLSPLGHAHRHSGTAQLAEPALQGAEIRRQGVDEDLLRDRFGIETGIRLAQVVGGQFRRRVIVGAFDDPSALAADASLPDVEDLHGGLEFFGHEGEDVAVGADGQDNGGFVEDLLQSGDLVAQTSGAFVVEVGRGGRHLLLPVADESAGVSGHEVRDAAGQFPVLLLADVTDAGSRAFVDVAEQAGATTAFGTTVDAGGAGAHREGLEQQVQRILDGPHLGEGAEVLDALATLPAGDIGPRNLLVHRDRKVGVGLVVAEHNVEPRFVFVDPRPLELEGFDLGVDDGPLHGVRGMDHRRGPRMQLGGIREVRVEPIAEVLRLPDVDHPPVGVPELVDPGRGGDRPRGRTVAGGFWHSDQDWSIGLRNRPVCDAATSATSSGVPWATTWPPPRPPSGPRSMMWSALPMTSRLCSMTMTVLPLSTRPWRSISSFEMSSKCRPVVGSSST